MDRVERLQQLCNKKDKFLQVKGGGEGGSRLVMGEKGLAELTNILYFWRRDNKGN